MANSFIVERLTGEYTLDSISASFCIPMFDPRTRQWVDEWCDDVAPGLKLPRVIEPWEEAGRINDRGAALTGLPEGSRSAPGRSTRSSSPRASGSRTRAT